MSNINNFNFNNLELKISNSNFWDFFITNNNNKGDCNSLSSTLCSVVHYDFNNDDIFIGDGGIKSLVEWELATNSGYTMNTFGLTGLDNGRINYNGDISNKNEELVNLLTGSTLNIIDNDNKLTLYPVNSYDGTIYSMVNDNDPFVGNYTKLRGGYYQGFYKLDGNTYEVLPTRVDKSWSSEFWIRKDSGVIDEGTVDIDNKGFFFYMGTRAENKFWNVWEGNNTGCTSNCEIDIDCLEIPTSGCTVLKETDITLLGEYGIGVPLSPPQITVDLITNGFLVYGRSKDGRPEKIEGEVGELVYNFNNKPNNNTCGSCRQNKDGLGSQTVCTYDGEGIAISRTATTITNKTNPFLIYGRANKNKNGSRCGQCNGPMDGLGNENVCTFSGVTSPEYEVDYNKDVIGNSLGFRITDTGQIGYRTLIQERDCVTNTIEVKKKEEYSKENIIPNDEWFYLVIKFVTNEKVECDLKNSKPRFGKLLFYVNGKLVFVVNEFEEFIARRLNEQSLKQVGVPFNISIGGGSQGLSKSKTFDGDDFNDLGLPIEKNFNGSFIGSISQFRFNICDLSLCNIRKQYEEDIKNYNDRNIIGE